MDGRPRLLVVTPDFPPATGGIQLLLGEVLRRLDRWEIRVQTRAVPSGIIQAEQSDLEVRRGRLATGTASIVELNVRACRGGTWRPDVVLCGHVIAGPGAVVAARAARCPLATYVYADEVPHRRRLARVALARSRRVIAISRYAARLAIEAGADPAAVVRVAPGAGPVTSVAPTRNGPSMVTVARLVDRYKGHDHVLEALRLVTVELPDVVWHVVGDGVLRPDLEARARAFGLAGNVHFHGSLPDEQRDAVVADASVFVMPSRVPPGGGGEGFGIVFLEAALLGTPSVAGNSGGIPDAVLDGTTGLLVDPKDPRAIADGLLRVLTDDKLRSRLGDGARARAEGFTWEAAAERVDAVLAELIAAS